MTISCEKSFLLLTVAGTNPRLYMKPYIRRGSHGTTFEIPRGTGQTTSIPMKSSGRYLGAIMSYRMMEELTWKHRCKSAWLAFNRLKKWLQSRQLSVRYKMHLWQKLRAHDPHLWDLGYEQHSQDIASISADSVHNDSDGDR